MDRESFNTRGPSSNLVAPVLTCGFVCFCSATSVLELSDQHFCLRVYRHRAWVCCHRKPPSNSPLDEKWRGSYTQWLLPDCGELQLTSKQFLCFSYLWLKAIKSCMSTDVLQQESSLPPHPSTPKKGWSLWAIILSVPGEPLSIWHLQWGQPVSRRFRLFHHQRTDIPNH